MKRLILIWSLLIVYETLALADNKTGLTAEQILENHFQAIGGKEKIATIKSRQAMGTIGVVNSSKPTRFLFFTESPNRLAVWYKFDTFDLSFVYNESRFYARPNTILAKNTLLASVGLVGRADRLEKKFSEMFSSGLMFGSMSIYNSLLEPNSDLSLKTNKTKKINNRETYIVEIKHKKSGNIKVFFDAETFMWVRTDFGKVELSDNRLELDNSGGNSLILDFYQEYANFSDVGGIKLPFLIKQSMVPPIAPNNRFSTVEIIVDEYRQNHPIDPEAYN